MKDLSQELQQLQGDGLYRSRRMTDSPQAVEMVVDGQRVLGFCSNDYLGLANHPDVRAAFLQGVEHWGAGSGAAHLINGHSRAHHALEEELADFTGYPRALLFSTGYMANLGVAQALCGRGDGVFEDRLNHASLLDAGLLSGARLQRYRHGDPDDLEDKLKARAHGEKLVMSDGVFSMDGDMAPAAELASVCRAHEAWFMLDDAHGFGVLGDRGAGTPERLGLTPEQVPVFMATLGKALGTAGAFVAGSEDLIEYLVQKSRTYIYTTASPPAVAEATRQSLRLVRAESWRRDKLAQLIRQFRSGAEQIGLQLMDSDSPIQPILLGASEKALQLSGKLLDKGILISAIRPPTVPRNTARLRVTLSAAHEPAHIDRLLDTIDTLI